MINMTMMIILILSLTIAVNGEYYTITVPSLGRKNIVNINCNNDLTVELDYTSTDNVQLIAYDSCDSNLYYPIWTFEMSKKIESETKKGTSPGYVCYGFKTESLLVSSTVRYQLNAYCSRSAIEIWVWIILLVGCLICIGSCILIWKKICNNRSNKRNHAVNVQHIQLVDTI